jgi:ABC-type oligopeptide transport system substrate-binding subunit
MIYNGWQADYLIRIISCGVGCVAQLKRMGWEDAAYDGLVDEASRTPDRAKRMALYRQADHQLVAEQTLVLPVSCGQDKVTLKPWVKNYSKNLLGRLYLHELIILEH